MHWPTHILIAKNIQMVIDEKLDTNLRSRWLKYGSVKPDMIPRLLRMKHLKNRSINPLGDMIEEMRKSEIPLTKRGMNKFSVNLGVIMHYITDFFCYAHNNPKFVNKMEHIKYEWAVAFRYWSTNPSEILNRAWENVNNFNDEGYKSIKDYINLKHDEYLSKSPGVDNDVEYSLEMCVTVALLIVGNKKLNIALSVA